MSRPVLWTAIALFVLGGGAFIYKHFALGMPVQPDRSARVWRVETSILARGHAERAPSERGRIELRIPDSDDTQLILDEQSYDDGLRFSVAEIDGERRATWRGRVEERTRRLSYTFRVHLPSGQTSVARTSSLEGPPLRYAPVHVPPEIEAIKDRLRLAEQDDPEAIIASAFGFVAHDIQTVTGATDDARLALRLREGSERGKSRLLVSLLGAAGVEARLATGIVLHRSGRSVFTHYVEARTNQGFMRLATSEESPGDFPRNFVRIAKGDQPMLATLGVDASQVEIQVLRESLQPSEIASFVAPSSPFWRSLSLYRLPVETQATLQILLLLPFAVLIAAVFRNLIGVRTFGVFMPILIALSLRNTDLVSGLVLVTSVICAGVLGRLLLDQLRLLFVPRICLLLCLVVLLVTALAQIGYAFEGRGFMSGLLFPIVILAILIERISVTTLEEGLQSTQKLLAGSLALAAVAYPIFQSDWLIHLFFGFPELIFCVMAGLVSIGGYRGYRAAEFWRFRSLAAAPPGGNP
jgi:7 transmembrane helices usually fused to an inactive transglutaminase/Inactive transglutaminase fused to 7 transmembrane helices